MNRLLKQTVIGSLAFSLFSAATFTVAPQVQASAAETLLSGGLAMIYVSSALNKMDNSEEGQADSLKNTKAQTGYYENAAAQARVQRIVKELEKSPLVKRKGYAVYVNPEEDFNAFMTIGRVMSVNKGALDKLDDNELAYVMAHELAHGEHKDVINGMKKQVGVATAAGVVSGDAGVLAAVAGNYLNNQVFTMSQEKNADKLGFQILKDTSFNVGGAPAAMAVLRDEYGDLYREGLNQVLKPNNHPKTSGRVTTNNQYMYEYSGNHVSVTDKTVYVNGVNIYTPAASGRYTGEERAYLMAGKLARMYHDGKIYSGSATYSGPTVYVAGDSVVTTPDSGVANAVAGNLNRAFDTTVKATSKDKKADSKKSDSKKSSTTSNTKNK